MRSGIASLILAVVCACGGSGQQKSTTTTEAGPVAQTATSVEAQCAKATAAAVPPKSERVTMEEVGESAGSGAFGGDPSNKVAGMKDLEALAKAKNWQELSTRAGEVPPAKRTKRWDELVTLGVNKNLAQLEAKGQAYEQLMFAEMALEAYPVLRRSKEFAERRTRVLVSGLGKCFKDSYDGSECLQLLDRAVKSDPANVELGKAAAELVYNSTGAKYVAAPYFKLLVVGRQDAPECASELLHDSVIAGFGLPDTYPQALAAREIAGHWCKSALDAPIRKAVLESSEGSYLLTNACGIVAAK